MYLIFLIMAVVLLMLLITEITKNLPDKSHIRILTEQQQQTNIMNNITVSTKQEQQHKINSMLIDGWVVSNTNKNGTINLTKKGRSTGLLIFLLIFALLPGVLYLIFTEGTRELSISIKD